MEGKKYRGKSKGEVDISDIELSVAYKDAGGQTIELKLDSFDTSLFEMSFPDFGDKDNLIKMEFESIETLEAIIKDFKTKFNLINNHGNRNKR